MDPARISELLRPFLGPSPPENLSSRAQADGSQSEPSGAVEGPAVLSFQPGFSPEEFVLSSIQLQSISIYIDLLLRWNARIDLTSVRDPEQIVTRHFGESLLAARHLFPRVPHPPRFSMGGDFNQHLIDVGSGAGFPGLPCKIWAPDISLTLIESNHKKAVFLREVARALTLTNVNVLAGRAEDIASQLQTAMAGAQQPRTNERCTVTLRAVERLETILPIALSLAGHGGRLAFLIGQAQVGLALALAPTMKWFEPIRVPLSSSRILLVGEGEG